MRLINKTKVRLPLKWIQKILDHLGVNPEIVVEYAENPDLKKPNCLYEGDLVDGLAVDTNKVFIYLGCWEDGKFKNYTAKFVRWIICHECRHQYYNYHRGNRGLVWRNESEEEGMRREEKACNRFANKIIGVPHKDYQVVAEKLTK